MAGPIVGAVLDDCPACNTDREVGQPRSTAPPPAKPTCCGPCPVQPLSLGINCQPMVGAGTREVDDCAAIRPVHACPLHARWRAGVQPEENPARRVQLQCLRRPETLPQEDTAVLPILCCHGDPLLSLITEEDVTSQGVHSNAGRACEVRGHHSLHTAPVGKHPADAHVLTIDPVDAVVQRVVVQRVCVGQPSHHLVGL